MNKKQLDEEKKKKKLKPCTENIYIENKKVRSELGLSDKAKIIME